MSTRIKKDIYIIFDCPEEKNDKKWLINEISSQYQGKVHAVYAKQILSKIERKNILGKIYTRMFKIIQVKSVLTRAKAEDVVICWDYLTGLYLNLFSVNNGNTINILSMNWLSPMKVKPSLYRKQELLIDNTKARIVVNSNDSIQKWCEYFQKDISDKMICIPDVYDSDQEFSSPITKKNKYCFTGGMNNRNWKLLADAALKLPEIEFVCIALKDDFLSKVSSIPKNMVVMYEVPTDKYYKIMKDAYIVLLPLIEERVSGLINILKAAQQGVPCLVSNMRATSQYYESVEGFVIDNECDSWVRIIKLWYSYSDEIYLNETKMFCDYIKAKFSPHEAAKHILSVINHIDLQ